MPEIVNVVVEGVLLLSVRFTVPALADGAATRPMAAKAKMAVKTAYFLFIKSPEIEPVALKQAVKATVDAPGLRAPKRNRAIARPQEAHGLKDLTWSDDPELQKGAAIVPRSSAAIFCISLRLPCGNLWKRLTTEGTKF